MFNQILIKNAAYVRCIFLNLIKYYLNMVRSMYNVCKSKLLLSILLCKPRWLLIEF